MSLHWLLGLVEVLTCNDIPRQGGVRNGYFCHSGASGAHGDLRQLSTHLCKPVHLVQVWPPERGSQAVGCFMVTLRAKGWKHPEFQWPKINQTAKDNFWMSFTILRFVAESGRSTETKIVNPKSIPCFSDNHQHIAYLSIFSPWEF